VFAASSGRVSVLADLLGPETSHTLFDLQRNMARVVHGFGGVEHADWRAYRSDVGSRPSAGFIDGDFVEQFLDIKDEDLIFEILEGASKWEKIESAYGDLCNLLEGLRRLH
jgi:DNA damage-binding protein 1